MRKVEIDATNQSLGRLASKIAVLLRGKDQATYEPRITPEVEVTVQNLDKVKFTGNKLKTKMYHRYTGYHSGIRTRSLEEAWALDPEKVLRSVVYNMLPVNKTRDKIMNNIKVAK